ncbi:hypothetical protein AAHE18_19G131700 [Arachis hypogaea]
MTRRPFSTAQALHASLSHNQRQRMLLLAATTTSTVVTRNTNDNEAGRDPVSFVRLSLPSQFCSTATKEHDDDWREAPPAMAVRGQIGGKLTWCDSDDTQWRRNSPPPLPSALSNLPFFSISV